MSCLVSFDKLRMIFRPVYPKPIEGCTLPYNIKEMNFLTLSLFKLIREISFFDGDMYCRNGLAPAHAGEELAGHFRQ